MRIGIDVTTLKWHRGPSRITRELLGAFEKASLPHEFMLYTPYSESRIPLSDNFIYRVVPMKRGRPWLNWTLPFAVKKDGIDAMFFPANDCWMLPFKPTVVALLDIAPATYLRKYQSLVDRLQNDLQLKMLPLASRRVITISNFSKKEILKKVPGLAGKLTVSYCGVNKIFKRDETLVSRQTPYILFVSGYDRRKNLENLIKAYKKMLAGGRNERLVLVGMSESQNPRLYYNAPELMRQYKIEAHVTLDTVKNDDKKLARLYHNAAMLVMPSFIEGFGLPVLEAMACGCPVACSNAASLPEVGGDAAMYFDPHDHNEMAEVMAKILTDSSLRKNMVARGYDNVKKFSWERMASDILAKLQTVACEI
jgi:glycosyltransferase involved in cell wall biosynthesis